jgi:short-subunit dehydrogenase
VDLQGRRALVTGASGGIGGAIARALHARGATVVVTGRNVEALEKLASELGARAEVLPADISSSKGARELAERAGEVDVLVANAALPASGEIDDYTPEQLDRAIAVNLAAPIHLSHALIDGMRKRGAGHVVFINSMSGKVALARGALYSGTKFGLRGFALGLRQDLEGSGVGVSTVFPGFVSDAGMFADTKIEAPPTVPAVTPERVARDVVRAIERNRAEIDAAPFASRVGGWLFGIAPGPVARLTKRLGGVELAHAIGEAQRNKR